MADQHAPCPRCGKQPEIIKVRGYWVAHCKHPALPADICATPMKSKNAALAAWDIEYKKDDPAATHQEQPK